MATKKGVWNLQQVRDKQLQDLWSYEGSTDEAGTLWGWGDGSGGRLGNNKVINFSSPIQIGSAQDWNSLGSDGRVLAMNAAIKDDGTLYTWGENSEGRLGQNQAGTGWPSYTNIKSSPVQVPGTTWSTFSRSSNTVAAIKTDGTMWVWGDNGKGQLGLNQGDVSYSSPTQLPGSTWKSVSCAYSFTSATKTDGTLWTWGQNTDGQLGHNNKTLYSSPTQVPGTSWAFTYLAEKEIWATRTDGTLWGMGYNQNGQLAQNTNGDNTANYSSPVQIPGTWAVGQNKMAAGYFNFYAIKGDGTLWFMGTGAYNSNGQNNTTEYSSPVQIGSGTDWDELAAGTTQAGAIKTDGTLWTWGANSTGQLGQNNTTTTNSPVQIPGSWRTGDGSLISGWSNFMAIRQP